MKKRAPLSVVPMHDFEILRTQTSQNCTLNTQNFSHITIGYTLSGTKIIHHDGVTITVSEGAIFLLDMGSYFEENRVGERGKFEQVIFRITPHKLQQIIFSLNLNYGFQTPHKQNLTNGAAHNVITEQSAQLQKFFLEMEEDLFNSSPSENLIRKRIKLNELILLLLSCADENVVQRLLHLADDSSAKFIATIYENMFEECTNEELARRANMSLTAFKVMFRSKFGTTPRRWIVAQRLDRAEFLLLTSNKTISEISFECGFATPSNFIKLFKLAFGTTPKEYRREQCDCEK